jgi:hypothetical protein
MKNLGAMMKQAQQMKQRMDEMQAELDQVEMTGAAGGGMVSLTATPSLPFRAERVGERWVSTRLCCRQNASGSTHPTLPSPP